MGVHSASDTEHDWPWYRQLLGARFADHPEIQTATLLVEDDSHPSTEALPDQWTRTDEWYNFDAAPDPDVSILLTIDESSYDGGTMGDEHPMAWYHEFEGGRSWYTAMGHTAASYDEPLFIGHLEGGLLWVLGLQPSTASSTMARRQGDDLFVRDVLIGKAGGERFVDVVIRNGVIDEITPSIGSSQNRERLLWAVMTSQGIAIRGDGIPRIGETADLILLPRAVTAPDFNRADLNAAWMISNGWLVDHGTKRQGH